MNHNKSEITKTAIDLVVGDVIRFDDGEVAEIQSITDDVDIYGNDCVVLFAVSNENEIEADLRLDEIVVVVLNECCESAA